MQLTGFSNVKKIVPKSWPNTLCGARANLLEICQNLLERLEIESYFYISYLITEDESWIFDYNPESTKWRSDGWHTKILLDQSKHS